MSYRNLRQSQAGFSLVEMAIVLVIIGLIITAITIGKDTMRNAELTRIYTSGVGPWIQSIYAYQAKTGGMLGCTAAADCAKPLIDAGVGSASCDATNGCVYTYQDSDGADKTITLTKITSEQKDTNGDCDGADANETDSRASIVVLTDSNLLEEGLDAVSGYVNGTYSAARADATAQTMCFNLTQFSSAYQNNL